MVLKLTAAISAVAVLATVTAVSVQRTSAQTAVAPREQVDLDQQFTQTVQPFLTTYCVECHSGEKPKGELDLRRYSSTKAIADAPVEWALLRDKLAAKDMPPDGAKHQPTDAARDQIVKWVDAIRADTAKKHAGDPGVVLVRRLSNAEYDYTIRDLTGFDIKPTREFPVDPANTAGFDNSGESLVMSSSLLDKYLKAAHEVADHMFLKPDGIGFAPTVMLAETDRDQYCVQNIIGLYHRQDIDYANYFQAAWRFKNRAALGKPQATLADFADGKLSAKYLGTVWSILEDEKPDVGPLVKLQSLWKQLPANADQDAARKGCEQMRDFVVEFRKKVEPRFLNLAGGGRGGGGGGGGTALLIWKNVQYATHRMTFDKTQLQVEGEPPTRPLDVANEPNSTGEFGPGKTVPVINTPGDPDLVVPAGQRERYEAAFAKFCRVFPDKFYMEERGRNYFNTKIDRGRFLSAGFHSNMGYFRDDQPLHDLILDEKPQKELDDLWFLFDFLADATERMYLEGGGGRAGRGAATAPSTMPQQASGAVVSESRTSEAKIKEAEARFVSGAGNPTVAQAGRDYYGWVNATLRAVEKARIDGVPKQLEALQQFAARAYRRPLTPAEKADLVAYFKSAREKDGLDIEDAMRETLVSILMSPDMTYRLDLMQSDKKIHPLTDYELASRLSYFLWSSIPDEELLAHAAAGDLHDPKVIAAQARRMSRDARVRGLAVEFAGNWLEFRRFQEITTVNKERFTNFSNDLRDAMFEEPTRFLTDVMQNNRSVLDLVYAKDTFVNPVLAKHYGIPVTATRKDEWVHVDDATQYNRGGLLPMAAFLTKNAPGLRTSPVKRGNWVVKNVLGQVIPPPPPGVPQLPPDETKLDLPLRDMLAHHRENPACATCHVKFDAMGLVFEGFGPIGEQRSADLAGHPIDARAQFPDGSEGTGFQGLRDYIKSRRQNDFINNLCAKLVAYSLNRSLIPSDDALVEQMRTRLTANDYRFDNVIETIVTSPQFLNKRGRDELAER